MDELNSDEYHNVFAIVMFICSHVSIGYRVQNAVSLAYIKRTNQRMKRMRKTNTINSLVYPVGSGQRGKEQTYFLYAFENVENCERLLMYSCICLNCLAIFNKIQSKRNPDVIWTRKPYNKSNFVMSRCNALV